MKTFLDLVVHQTSSNSHKRLRLLLVPPLPLERATNAARPVEIQTYIHLRYPYSLQQSWPGKYITCFHSVVVINCLKAKFTLLIFTNRVIPIPCRKPCASIKRPQQQLGSKSPREVCASANWLTCQLRSHLPLQHSLKNTPVTKTSRMNSQMEVWKMSFLFTVHNFPVPY